MQGKKEWKRRKNEKWEKKNFKKKLIKKSIIQNFEQ